MVQEMISRAESPAIDPWVRVGFGAKAFNAVIEPAYAGNRVEDLSRLMFAFVAIRGDIQTPAWIGEVADQLARKSAEMLAQVWPS